MSETNKSLPRVNVNNVPQATSASLGAKTLRKCWLNWAMHNITVASYDRMEGHGFVKSLLPAVEKLYPGDEKKQAEVLMPHTAYFNTEPQLGAMIPGIVIGMEEQRAR